MGLKVQLQSLVISPERIKAMDEQGIDTEALSINPIFWYKAEPDLAGEVVKLQNEKLAEICAVQPDRFVGLASAALQHRISQPSSSNMPSSGSDSASSPAPPTARNSPPRRVIYAQVSKCC